MSAPDTLHCPGKENRYSFLAHFDNILYIFATPVHNTNTASPYI